MRFTSITRSLYVGAAACLGLLPAQAEAGPLIDWLFGRRAAAPAYPVGQPVPMGTGYDAGYGVYGNAGAGAAAPYTSGYAPGGYAANYGNYYGSRLPVIGPGGAGYMAPNPSGVSAATMPSTLSYVPNFRTNSYRAPVTYYRPLMTTDPNTGGQVVAMAPCTSYEYQTQRVPILGRSALYGSTVAPPSQPMPQAMQTYTLPSGGIPLAMNAPNYPLPSYSVPQRQYASAYGGYGPSVSPFSSLRPQTGLMNPPAVGGYPTSPLGSPDYYGSSQSGGSTGTYPSPTGQPAWGSMQTPGLVAPQAPGVTRTPAPTWGQRTTPPEDYPGSSAPSTSPDYSLPPTGGSDGEYFPPSTDPRADETPSLSSFGDRNAGVSRKPQLRSLVRQPSTNQSDRSRSVGRAPSLKAPNTDRFEETLPTMAPIPVPEDFQLEPKWNAPLLKDGDMTAMRPINPEVAQYAGQSKQIHWASFEERTSRKPEIAPRRGFRPIEDSGANEVVDQPSLSVLPPTNFSQPNRVSDSNVNAVRQSSVQPPSRSRYDSSGWKASRQ